MMWTSASNRDPLLRRMPGRLALRGGLAAALALLASAVAAQPGSLFPEPFRVEHHLEQTDADGSRFVSEPVVDTYGGSWIVSERPDGSRLIVDLSRRELTGIRPEKTAYWTVSFDRYAELQSRALRAQGLDDGSGPEGDADEDGGFASRAAAAAGAASGEPPELVVEEVTGISAASATSTSGPTRESEDLTARVGVHHLRVAAADRSSERAGLEVWVDPTIRLTPRAIEALRAFESGLSPSGVDETGSAAENPGRYLAAARSHARGAVPVRTSRPAALSEETGEPLGRIEDVATALEPLDAFPRELLEIPEGFRRIPHPLEAAVRFLEEDRELNRRMAGSSGSGSR